MTMLKGLAFKRLSQPAVFGLVRQASGTLDALT
jgi:hypothetical protein